MNKIKFANQSEPNLQMGQLWRYHDHENDEGEEQDIYILARVNNQYVLISLQCGGVWTDPVDCIDDVFEDQSDYFHLVKESFTVTP